MATTKSNGGRSTAKRATSTRARTSTTSRSKSDDNVVERAGRTVRDRPYASAAIATGAVTAVAAAAAGAFFFSRRDKSFKEASDELSDRVKDSVTGAGDKIKEITGRGKSSRSAKAGSDGRSQQDIAAEALTIKKNNASAPAIDNLSSTEIKTGAIAY